MASTRIEVRDIIDSEGILTQLSDIEKGLDGLKGSLKGIAVDKKIKLSEIISTKGFEEASRQVAMLSDALTKLEKAYEVNREAIKNISEALKVQAVASAAATEASERASAVSVKTNKLTEGEINMLNALKKAIEAKDESEIKAQLTMTKEYDSLNLLTAQMKLLEEEIKKKTQAETQNDSLVKTLVETHRKLKEQITATKEALDLQKAKTNQLNQVVDKHNKLQGQELQDLQDLRLALEATDTSWANDVKNINAADMSYNQLSATYTALKDKLNSVHISDIQQGSDYEMLQKKLKELYETMNDYQQSTGKFQLNVGRYRSAFDGLGFSIQQVLREVPSAINLNQFFLAISNNIPQVVDQIKLFNKQQEELAVNLEEIRQKQGEQSKEYQEGLKQQMSLGKKFLTTIFSWQTAILAGLMLLRKLPDIIEKIKDKLKDARIDHNIVSIESAMRELTIATNEAVSETSTRLGLLTNQLKSLTRGSDEWKTVISEINDITGSNLDSVTATIDQVNKVTEAYIQQQTILAQNNEIVSMIAKWDINKKKRSLLDNASSIAEIAQIIGVSPDDSKLTEAWDKYHSRGGNIAKKYSEWQTFLYSYLPIGDDPASWAFRNMFQSVMPTGETSTSKGRTSTPSEQEITDKYWEAEEARLKVMDDGYEKELQLAMLAHDKSISDIENWLKEQEDRLKENVRNRFITQKGANNQLEVLKKQGNTIMTGLDEDYFNKEKELYEKYAMIRINNEIEATEVTLEHTKRRIKTRTDEVENNKAVAKNIALLQNQLTELEKVNTEGIEDGEKKKEEAIKKVNEQLQKQKDLLKFDQQLKNYKNIWQIVGLDNDTMLGKAFGGDKKGWLSFLGIEGVTDENADVVFEQWVNSAGEALKGFGSEVKDFLGGMLDTWGDYFDKQAEMAKNNTDQAKEYWQTQIELQKQGYANEVNTAWATYQEKLKIQQASEQKARQWAATSKYLSDIESGASMAVAVANILKDFTKIPGLGIPLAAGAVTTLLSMWSTYKSQVQTYGEGGYEPLVGGSHASGHDIDMGFTNRRGRRVHTEGGEAFGVFNRRAVKRYGHDMLGGFVDMANSGRLALRDMSKVDGNLNFVLPKNESVSLTKVEKLLTSVDTAVNSTTYVGADGRIVVKNGNNVKRIRR